MLNILKRIWNYIWGGLKGLLQTLCDHMFDTAKEIVKDKELVALAFDAIKAAAEDKLTGSEAFEEAKKKFLEAAKAAGKEINTAFANLVIEYVYNSWKNLGYPKE